MHTERTSLKSQSSVRKGLIFRPFHNYLLFACISLLMPVLLYLPFSLLRVPLGLLAVFFVPGNALMKALFFRDRDHTPVERAAISFGLSVVILPILTLLLNYLPWGIQPGPIACSLAIWSSVLYTVAAFRRRREGLDMNAWFPGHQTPQWWFNVAHLPSRNTRFAVVGLVGLLVIAGLLFVIPDRSQHYTEFYMLGIDGQADNFPNQVAPGKMISITLGIANHEGADLSYKIELTSGVQPFAKASPISVKQGESWENKIYFTVPHPGKDQYVDILLYRPNDTSPYRHLRLWLNTY